jgi:hypothetical protein
MLKVLRLLFVLKNKAKVKKYSFLSTNPKKGIAAEWGTASLSAVSLLKRLKLDPRFK